jgi:hypothetical protein
MAAAELVLRLSIVLQCSALNMQLKKLHHATSTQLEQQYMIC